MKILLAERCDAPVICDIVHRTIEGIYPNYYPTEVVKFFVDYHNEEKIRADIEQYMVYVIEDNDQIVATGSIDGRTIGRLYVLPEYQGKGYGYEMMNFLEATVSKEYPTSFLEASLPSYDYYLRRGYYPVEYLKYEVENHRVLCYYTMEKKLT